jgi:hypothetical protein
MTTAESLLAYGCDCSMVNNAELTELIDAASDIIALTSNMQITGRCEHEVRPVGNRDCWPSSLQDRIFGMGSVVSLGVPMEGINPTVVEVKLDGAVLASVTDYIVQSSDAELYRMVIRLNSDGNPTPWPSSQRWWRPDSEDNTWTLTYEEGLSIDSPGMSKAANEVACWLVNDTVAKRKRRLDPRATSASGGGVQIGLRARTEQIKSGEVDLPALTELFAVYLPGGRFPTQVLSPELRDGWTFYSQPAAA